MTLSYFDTSVKNLYKIDNGNWLEYKGPIDIEPGKTIYAKGILSSGKDADIISYTSVLPGDALGEVTYDGDDSTAMSFTQGQRYKILVDYNMRGRKVDILANTYDTANYYFYDQNDNLLQDIFYYASSGKSTQRLDIPKETSYIVCSARFNRFEVYEIKPVSIPSITVTKNYSVLTENGIEVGKNKIEISYFDTSIKNLYKIDDGDWLEYKGFIELEIGKTIYAKGILPSGKDSDIISYQTVFPSDALGTLAYDGDDSTNELYNPGESRKILVDYNMQGKKVEIVSQAGNMAHYYFYDQNNNELGRIYLYAGSGKNSQIVDIPMGTNNIVCAGYYQPLYVYEISPVIE